MIHEEQFALVSKSMH